MTLAQIAILLLFYAGLFLVISLHGQKLTVAERKTFIFVSISSAVIIFVANYLLFRLGVMSFLPWPNNFMHTFLWIGICLVYLYFGVRGRRSVAAQYGMFVVLSFIVKYAEQRLLGTWELDHFFFIKGNPAYILGWSLVDGIYPIAVSLGLRLVGRFVPGLVLA